MSSKLAQLVERERAHLAENAPSEGDWDRILCAARLQATSQESSALCRASWRTGFSFGGVLLGRGRRAWTWGVVALAGASLAAAAPRLGRALLTHRPSTAPIVDSTQTDEPWPGGRRATKFLGGRPVSVSAFSADPVTMAPLDGVVAPGAAAPAGAAAPDAPAGAAAPVVRAPSPTPRPASQPRAAARPVPGNAAFPTGRSSTEDQFTTELAVIERAQHALAVGNGTLAQRELLAMPSSAGSPFAEDRAFLRAIASCASADATLGRGEAERLLQRWPHSVYAQRAQLACKLGSR